MSGRSGKNGVVAMSTRKRQIKPDDVSGKPYIFVSYARKDEEMVQSVLQLLRKNHFRFWYDMGLKSGEEWAEDLGDKIDRCEQFMVLISENAVRSKYVRKEVGMATDQEKNMLIVYLTETKLSSGLRLLLSDIHAIHREYYARDCDFEKAICESVSRNVFYSVEPALENPGKSIHEGAEKEFLESYQLLNKIGAGGLCTVYAALQKRTNNMVVVKCGRTDMSFPGAGLMAMFASEKRILSKAPRAGCPFLPTLLDWYQDENNVFLIETYIQGTSLQKVGPLSEKEVVEIAKKILAILRCLHRSHIAYLDLKPSNLIMDQWGNLYLIDFNSAVLLEGDELPRYLTATAGFSPPEQYEREAVVHFSSDIFALGRTMEYLLSPTADAWRNNAPIRFCRKGVSVELEDLLTRMTDPRASERIQTADQVLQALERYKTRNIFKKAKLWWESRSRIRAYTAGAQQRREKRVQIIREMAAVQTEIIRTDISTVIEDDTILTAASNSIHITPEKPPEPPYDITTPL